MRLLFMGTGEISLPTLRWLLETGGAEGGELVAVYTQPDKPVGRSQILTPPEVKVLALAGGIPVFQPERFRNNRTAVEEFAALRPDLVVVMAYGQILPRSILAVPTFACVNLHASLLPRHRGASPIQAAIREGDAETGLTLMHVAPELDAGDMILKRSLPIRPDETGGSLHDRLADLGPEVIAEGLRLFREGRAESEPQDPGLVTYTGKLGREDGEIDWNLGAGAIERLIRAYDPWPGTTTGFCASGGDRKLKIFPGARVVAGDGSAPGTVLACDETLVVNCGSGALEFRGDLQLEGRRRMSVADFLRGSSLPKGTILGRI